MELLQTCSMRTQQELSDQTMLRFEVSCR